MKGGSKEKENIEIEESEEEKEKKKCVCPNCDITFLKTCTLEKQVLSRGDSSIFP